MHGKQPSDKNHLNSPMPQENLHSRTASSVTSDTIEIEDYQEPNPSNPEAVKADRRRARKRKLIIAASSTVLLATIIVAGTTGLFIRGPSSDDQAGSQAAKIQVFCQLTDFPNVCISRLTNYTERDPSGSRAGPRSLLLSSVAANIETVGSVYRIAKRIVEKKLNDRAQKAAEDCERLLTYAAAELNASYAGIDPATSGSIPCALSNVLSGLSAAVAFEQTCHDGFGGGGAETAEMRAVLWNATLETRNNLALMSEFPAMGERRMRKLMAAVVDGERMVWRAARGEADVVVAKDGSGDFRTIVAALEVARKEREGRFVIYVKEGVYEESVWVTWEMKYVTMYGDGANRTVVTGSRGFKDGFTVYQTATFAVSGVAFMARDMGFANTAGPEKAQAVALQVESDLAVFHKCHINGYQNTLHAHAQRQFYRSCTISGSIDIISGGAAAIFQNCEIMVKKPEPGQENIITAQSRLDRHQTTGIILQNCTISANDDLIPARGDVATYLGRPVKEHSRTVVMQSTIGDLVRPEGWASGPGDVGLEQTVYFAEFENRGAGADVAERVNWQGFHVLRDVAEATRFTAGEFVEGIYWLNMTGVQFYTGIIDAL